MGQNHSSPRVPFPATSLVPLEASPNNAFDEDDEVLSRLYRRFRVLIIGRANAGKTTILEKVCGGSSSDAVAYRGGIRVSWRQRSYTSARVVG